MRSLDIAFVVPRFVTGGGVENYLRRLLGWLAGRDHRLHVYCIDGEPMPGVLIHRLRGSARPRRFFRAARDVPLTDHDIVQGMGRSTRHTVYRAGGGAHAAWLAASGRWRGPGDRLEVRLDRLAMERAKIVVCNSELAAADIRHHYRIADPKLRVVRNGVDCARFRPSQALRESARAAWGARGRVAMFVGHAFRRKGLETAIQAFERVADPSDRFVIIGRDAHARRVLMPARRRLGERLLIMGPRTDPERWLPGADATLLPTLYDSAANTTLESMAAGVPPVVSSRDGNNELAVDARLVVEDPRDVGGFAQALEYAWIAADLGERCRTSMEDWPTSRNGLAMEKVYLEIVDG